MVLYGCADFNLLLLVFVRAALSMERIWHDCGAVGTRVRWLSTGENILFRATKKIANLFGGTSRKLYFCRGFPKET